MLARCFVLDIFVLNDKIKGKFCIYTCFLALLLSAIANYRHFKAIGRGKRDKRVQERKHRLAKYVFGFSSVSSICSSLFLAVWWLFIADTVALEE